MAKRRTFGIIGLGNFGRAVAGELARFGDDVIGVDVDGKAVDAMVETLTRALIGDGRDAEALREAGIGECDVVIVAVGEPMEASVLALMNAKLLGVPRILAKADSKMHHRILSKLGADRVVHPEEEMGLHIAQVMHNPLVRDYVSVGNGYHVVNFFVPEALQGKRLAELELLEGHELRCVGVMRGSKFVGDRHMDCELAEDDRLLLLGTRENLQAFGATL
ncbi:TrkA family potassium uptake protein [Psychromarinibacter sp. C21-152]|uniref:TrkA family potassium uptake protein n=1 Tax=Psychromarinibacter sediminicola TaxID=3033385 RepID=A0AAE3T703_9RHOB|nr:TrkA family potassium uptake protein [Psychromarinibacter sediminicola]MDF0599855.1 TrkA family potassium uptake protein [Psychromarinibacter sediminicola]